MATIVYRDAKIFLNGSELTAALHEFGATYAVEILDETCFGDDTRIKKGGLRIGTMTGKGYVDSAVDLENFIFAGIGGFSTLGGSVVNPAYQSGSQVEDTVLVVFPDGITEGSTTTGQGFAMKGVIEKMDIGGAVGVLYKIDFSAQTRSIEA